jgi:hypothetical protein
MHKDGLALHGQGLKVAIVEHDAVFSPDDLAADRHKKGGVTPCARFGAPVGRGFENDPNRVARLHERLARRRTRLYHGHRLFVEDQIIDLHIEVVRPTCGTPKKEKSHQGHPREAEEAWELRGRKLGVHHCLL